MGVVSPSILFRVLPSGVIVGFASYLSGVESVSIWNIIFDLLNGDVNFAIHKEAFKDYHINGLHYDKSEKIALIPNGDVGGAGEKIDKVYHVAWTTKTSWASKQSEVRALYTS